MKRTKLLLIAVLTALAGCTGTPSGPASDSAAASAAAAADEATVSKIVWDGGADSPKLSMPTPLRVTQPTVGKVEPGPGARLAMGQLVTFDSVVVDGETGNVEASTFGGDKPNQLLLVPSAANVTMLAAMQSSRVGTRFVYVVPTAEADGTADGVEAGPTPSGTASKVIGISIRYATEIPGTAQGPEKAPDHRLPKVQLGSDGTPSIVPLKTTPGSKLASEVLIEGSGRPVQQGQSVAAKYYGWLWDGTPFDAVWGDQAPEVIGPDGAISGWQTAIVGKKVGSRVLMVVPPALAYGGAGHGSIPPGATLVFLVDILAAY